MKNNSSMQFQKLQQTAIGLLLENEIITAKKEAYETVMRQQKLNAIFNIGNW